jgi:hypothetical protein
MNRCKEMETVRMMVSGPAVADRCNLMGQELRSLSSSNKENVLVSAGVSCPKPPRDLGLQVMVKGNMPWFQFRTLKRYN